MPIPPRVSVVTEGDARESGDEETELPQGLEALGCVSPLRESLREKWSAARSQDSAPKGTLETYEMRLRLAETRREQFRTWLVSRADESDALAGTSAGERVARAQQRKASALHNKREHYRVRIERLMEGVHFAPFTAVKSPTRKARKFPSLSRPRLRLCALLSDSASRVCLQLPRTEGCDASPRVLSA